MSEKRWSVVRNIVKGLLTAVGITILFMFIIAGAAMMTEISDEALTWLNQIIKLASIALGVRAAVGRGGQQGFVTGIVTALLYMILGYTSYSIFGGGEILALPMLGEMLMGAAAGGIFGAVCANLTPRKARRAVKS